VPTCAVNIAFPLTPSPLCSELYTKILLSLTDSVKNCPLYTLGVFIVQSMCYVPSELPTGAVCHV